jgi:hypothetical protein
VLDFAPQATAEHLMTPLPIGNVAVTGGAWSHAPYRSRKENNDDRAYSSDGRRSSHRLPVHKLLRALNIKDETEHRQDHESAKFGNDDALILTIGNFLPRMIPNIVISKRGDLVPLLLSVIRFHPDASQRVDLLHHLFHLIKKPDVKQRQAIVEGVVILAECLSSERIEEEIVPHFWDLVNTMLVLLIPTDH